MHLIEHDSTHFTFFLIAFAVAVELGVFKLSITKLCQDLLSETSAWFSDTIRLATTRVQNLNSRSYIRWAEVLVVLAHHIIHISTTWVSNLLCKLINICIHIVLECCWPLLVTREHRIASKLVLQLLHISVVVETICLNIWIGQIWFHHLLHLLSLTILLLPIIVFSSRTKCLNESGLWFHLQIRTGRVRWQYSCCMIGLIPCVFVKL